MKLERELMRGAGPTAVLQLLADRPMYGYELIETLERRTGGVLAMGQSTLYPMLYNLESKGLIEPEWRAGDTGRERKYYALTDKGRGKLRADLEQWSRLADALASLRIIGGASA